VRCRAGNGDNVISVKVICAFNYATDLLNSKNTCLHYTVERRS